MVLIIDDLLHNLFVQPWVFLFKQLHQYALSEMYPLEKIESAIKENRMEYELGELSQQDYEEGEKILNDKHQIAKKVKEMGAGVTAQYLH